MESMWGFENQHPLVPSGKIINGFLAWYFWVLVMHGIVSVMLMLENMIATTAVESWKIRELVERLRRIK